MAQFSANGCSHRRSVSSSRVGNTVMNLTPTHVLMWGTSPNLTLIGTVFDIGLLRMENT